jgi:hypothetical protein
MQWNALTSSQLNISRLRAGILTATTAIGMLFATSESCGGQAYSFTFAQQVYECHISGQRVFSDQPCAADATRREVTITNTMQAKEADIGYKASPAKSHKPKPFAGLADPHDKQRERCTKLSNDKQRINTQLRAGYTGKQGERLRERLRKIDGEYFDLRCSS